MCRRQTILSLHKSLSIHAVYKNFLVGCDHACSELYIFSLQKAEFPSKVTIMQIRYIYLNYIIGWYVYKHEWENTIYLFSFCRGFCFCCIEIFRFILFHFFINCYCVFQYILDCDGMVKTKECSKLSKKKTLLYIKVCLHSYSDENNPRDFNVSFFRKKITKNGLKGHPTIHYTLHGIVQYILFRRVSVLHWVGWLVIITVNLKWSHAI